MTRLVAALALALGLASPVPAQEFSGLARLDAAASHLRDARRGGLEIELALSQAVPWRVFTLDDPRRLVLEFSELDWAGAGPELAEEAEIEGLRFGTPRPGWSRMEVGLADPLAVASAEMRLDEATGTARLRVELVRSAADAFAAAARPATAPAPAPVPTRKPDDAQLVVAIDPGHGGIDPGAEREGLVEAELMLQLARELAEAVNRSGTMRAVLTRDADIFVPLSERMTIARAAGADLLISLHADALEVDEASGASVYTLSSEALDRASDRMAERHQRGDLLSGVDLSGQDDRVATVLMDLARTETAPQSQRLATALVEGLRGSRARINGKPLRAAPLAVLNAADFASVLVEVGFLSNDADRTLLQIPEGRAPVIAGLVAGLQAWAAEEAARAPLLRR